MDRLTAHGFLQAWELGQGQLPWGRALAMLTAANADKDSNKLASLDLASRDKLLLELREATFGPILDGFSLCGQCGEGMEYSLTSEQIRQLAGTGHEARPGVFEINNGDYSLAVRLPNTDDLAAMTQCEASQRSSILLLRCIMNARHCGEEVPPKTLPPEITDEVAQQVAGRAGIADLMLDLVCPNCGQAEQIAFDIGAFLWSEVAGEAKRLLREVHALAQAYGWRETDILSMSPARRHAYLELVA